MKHWILALAACGAVAAIPACSSDDSGGGTGGGGTVGGTGGVVTGGTGGTGGGITGGSGGVGNTGGSTGGTGNVGTGGGGPNCGNTVQGQPCTALQTNNPAQTACLQGDCCDETEACLDNQECAALVFCGATCLQAGGTQESCAAECQACASDPGTVTIYNAIQTCITACTGNPQDGGTGGSPADAAAD